MDDLWRRGFLYSELRPLLTGDDPAHYLLERLWDFPSAHATADRLRAGLDLLSDLDARPLVMRTAEASRVHRAMAALRSVPAGATATQVDMAWMTDQDHIAQAIGTETAQAADLLVRLHHHPTGILLTWPRTGRRSSSDTASAGRSPVGTARPTRGDGPPNRFATSGSDSKGSAPPQACRRRHSRSPRRAGARRSTRRAAEHLEPGPGHAPRSVDLTVLVAAESPAAIDRGDFLSVLGPNGGVEGAGRSLGRFADLLGRRATAALREAARADEAAHPGQLRRGGVRPAPPALGKRCRQAGDPVPRGRPRRTARSSRFSARAGGHSPRRRHPRPVVRQVARV